jgi:hypothetical protein
VKKFVAAVAVLGGLLSLGAAPTGAEAASGMCPSGYACLYTKSAYDNTYGTYYRTFYKYGYYNLQGEYGARVMINNQTGGAKVWLCYGYNGTDCFAGPAAQGPRYDFNIDPINSIKLTAS